ncbi:MAG: uncharacterized protein QOF76_4628 [Solirubrobacteraceae bacterium]|nr:uncharacterized protein [Solirubrobacteraceae bacterium]
MGRKRICGAVAALALLVCAAPAGATLFVTANSTSDKGYISLTAVGSTDLQNLSLGELTSHGYVQLGPPPTLYSFGTFPTYGELGSWTLDRATTWQCAHLTRTFAVSGTHPDGTQETNTFTVRTPSCAHRFSLDYKPQVQPGTIATIFLRDTFETGSAKARLCRKAPGLLATKRCQTISFAPSQPVARTQFGVPTKGRWKITLSADKQRTDRVLDVGVKPRPSDIATLPDVVTTGDSLMQGPDALLGDRLAGRADVHSDVHIGSGLTKQIVVDWTKLPGAQVKEFHPKATLLFLGTNDDSPIQPPGGEYIACCGPDWIAEYVRRAQIAMKTYTAHGGHIFWLTIPLPADGYRQKNVLAVNLALQQAVQGIPRAHLIDMAAIFTPNNQYRATMPYEGKEVRVRQPDGVHLSVAGSNIADTYMIQALEQYGIL